MKFIYASKQNEDYVKCVTAFTQCEVNFVAQVQNDEPFTPKIQQQDGETINGANAICRYANSLAKNPLQGNDLAVDEWMEWEEQHLVPFFSKIDKTNDLQTLKAEFVEILEEKFTKTTPFLVGSSLTLADIVVTPILRAIVAKYGKFIDNEFVKEYCNTMWASKVFQVNTVTGAKSTINIDPKAANGETYDSILTLVYTLFQSGIENAFPGVLKQLNITNCDVTRTKNPAHGDYQCNSAMNIFKYLKTIKDTSMPSPRHVAQQIVDHMPANSVLTKYAVAGPGFINAFIQPNFLKNRILTILRHGVKANPCKPLQIVVDFSSPNIAKDMHVGHLRSTIIGDAMCRILEFQGHKILRINHVGDWGTQFGMLICHLMDVYPTWQEEMPNISDLTQLYKNAKSRFDEDTAFHERSKQQVVLLQSGDEQSLNVWKTLCEISRTEFQKVYKRLDVTLTEMGESFYNPHIPKVIDMLKAQNITEDSNGALVVFTKKYKQPFMLLKSDGSYLYDTTDIAALWYRLNVQKADWIIIYTDYTQQDHFGLLFEVGQMSKILDLKKHRVNHIGFGTVNDESGSRFKTRSGEVVRLVDLLDESKKRMKEQLLERIESGQTSLPLDKVDEAAEKIGYGAVKYFDLRQSPSSNYIFSFDRMLSTNGDTAVYLLFAYARISSIIRKSGVDVSTLINDNDVLNIADPNELALVMELLQLQDVLTFINKDLSSNRLCAYLYSISERVQTFVTSCRVIGSPEQNSRLLLCKATLQVMHTCFSLLGIDPLDQI